MVTAAQSLSSQLAALKNIGTMKSAILNRLNLQPAQVRGFQDTSNFDKTIGNLYTTGLNTSASLNTQEGNVNTKYNLDKVQAGVNRDRALKALSENAAGRGMLQSSDYLDQVSNATGDYNRYMQGLGADYGAQINTIGTQRLNLGRNLAQGQMDAESAYGTALSKFLSDQAISAWTNALKQNQLQQQQKDQAALLAAVQKNSQRLAAPRTVSSTPRTPTSQINWSSPMAGSYNPVVPSVSNAQAVQQAAMLRRLAQQQSGTYAKGGRY